MNGPRLLGQLLCALTLALFGVPRACGQDGKPLAEDELPRFLGPVSPDQFTWRIVNGPDFVVYHGKANPPLTGSVGFYLGGWPQDLQQSGTTIRSRLGRYPVQWYRSTGTEGSIQQEAIIALGGVEDMKAHVWAEASNEQELGKLLSALGQLPTFSSGALPDRFQWLHVLLLEQQRIRRLVWVCWWGVVLASAWFVDRICRRPRVARAVRSLIFSGIIALWIPATIGVMFLSPPIAIHWFRTANGFLLFAAAGIVCLFGVLLASVLFLVRFFRTRKSSSSPVRNRDLSGPAER